MYQLKNIHICGIYNFFFFWGGEFVYGPINNVTLQSYSISIVVGSKWRSFATSGSNTTFIALGWDGASPSCFSPRRAFRNSAYKHIAQE
jgi:hypothetical protein